jgi:hypothetical protein
MILYQNGPYTMRPGAGRKWFEVHKDCGTASLRVAIIGQGPGPKLGLERAIAEADRRATDDRIEASRCSLQKREAILDYFDRTGRWPHKT